MKVILREDLENLGEMGDTVKVADGYARNYLIPRKLAVLADTASAKQIEHELRIIKKREEKRNAGLREVADKLRAVTIEMRVRAGDNDKIFGSVTTTQIAEKLNELGFEIGRKSVLLTEPIKSLGIFPVPVKLARGIEAEVKVWVAPIEEPKPEPAAVEADDDDDDTDTD